MRPIKISTKITSRESEAFKRYLREVSEIKPFETAQDEYECAMKAFNGDDKAKEELITRNLRFVISCAKQYHQKGVSLEDLVNEGNIGISTAADRFDPTMGNKFISYAVWYIRRDIMAFISSYSRTIKLPINRVSAVSKFKKIISELEQKLQRTVTDDDIIENHPEYTIDDVELLTELSFGDVSSLDVSVGDDDSASLYELIADSSLGRTDDLVMQADLEVSIDILFSVLKPSEVELLTMLYGLDGELPRTLADVGEHFEVSREMIRQRRDKAFRRIKGRFRNGAKHILNN